MFDSSFYYLTTESLFLEEAMSMQITTSNKQVFQMVFPLKKIYCTSESCNYIYVFRLLCAVKFNSSRTKLNKNWRTKRELEPSAHKATFADGSHTFAMYGLRNHRAKTTTIPVHIRQQFQAYKAPPKKSIFPNERPGEFLGFFPTTSNFFSTPLAIIIICSPRPTIALATLRGEKDTGSLN